MKRMMSLLLALLLLTVPALAEPAANPPQAEQSAELTYEELEMYLSAVAYAALNDPDVRIVTDEDGATLCDFAGGQLEIADEQLSESTALLSFTLRENQPDPRGLFIGSTLEQLLQVYPNDNPGLYGTYYDAALYVIGDKPEMSVGYLLRDGQRVTEVEHCVYHWVPDGVIACGVAYRLDQGEIVGIRVYGMADLIEEADAQQQIAAVGDMQEIQEYYAYPQSVDGSVLSPFDREDLTFGGVDFLDLTAEAAQAAFGPAPVDEWTVDSTGEYLRNLAWDGISVLLIYDAQKNFLRVDSLVITDDVMEGPRGTRVGDWMDTVIYRFRHSDGGLNDTGVVLYGDGETPPYGLLSYGPDTAALTYAFQLDDGRTVLWYVTFEDAVLDSMRLLVR
ncbi:MAG: hypothetical protein IKP32_08545 [Clostridia bacterium]|nr:hypothetical protein [Clostridia bacterium]